MGRDSCVPEMRSVRLTAEISRMRGWSPNLSSGVVQDASEGDPKNYEVAEQSDFQLQISKFPTCKDQNSNPMSKVAVILKSQNSILESRIVFWVAFR